MLWAFSSPTPQLHFLEEETVYLRIDQPAQVLVANREGIGI